MRLRLALPVQVRRPAAVAALTVCAALLAVAACSGSAPGTAGRPNVLVILLDTVRADRLSSYGHSRATTPKIDALAAGGVRFDRFFSTSSWTLPAHASLFTGLYPAGHRATQETLALADEPPTLAGLLSAAGYRTWAASANPVVSSATGLARGFQTFVETYRPEHATRYPDHPNNLAFQRFLDDAGGDKQRPFFAFVNYVEAHVPYRPPPDILQRFVDPSRSRQEIIAASRLMLPDHYLRGPLSAAQFAVLNEMYDAEVAFLDDLVADLMARLEAAGHRRDTLVIITSDHGENIGDHGHFDHVFSVYNSTLHIPLVVLFPDGSRAGRVRGDTAQILDLFPTILAHCGVDGPPRPAARDLFAAGAETVAAPAMAEFYYPRQVLSVFPRADLERHGRRLLPYMRRLRALQDRDTKIIWSSDGAHELYRLSTDPGEADNLARHHDHAAALQRWLARLTAVVEAAAGDRPLEPPPPRGTDLPGFESLIDDPATRERLRSLGYVE